MQVYRYNRFVAIHVNPGGETVYLDPQHARALAKALHACARDVTLTPDWAKSNFHTVQWSNVPMDRLRKTTEKEEHDE